MLALTPQEQARVEENMGLVGMVLNTYVHTPPPGSVYTMEDLYQIGCVGLCKAVQTDKAGHSAAFSTYASRLIRNEIYDALEYSTRHGNRAVRKGDKLCGTRVIPLIVEEEKLRREQENERRVHSQELAQAQREEAAGK